MSRAFTKLLTLAILAAVPVITTRGDAAEGCRRCLWQGDLIGGQKTPCGESGCGPRYWGAYWDEPNCPDPCDRCGRHQGGVAEGPRLDLLAPWQLPPGKGFQSPKQHGYATEGHCHSCGHSWWPHWLKPGRLFD